MTAGREIAITPSINDFPADLTAMGYTSVFIHFPQTPTSPPKNHHLSPSLLGAPRAVPANSAKQSKRGLKHLKSLSSLKSGKRSRSKAPPSPNVTHESSSEINIHTPQTTAITKSKKSNYAKALPTPLANELALAQLMDGGKLDDHVKRYTKAQAKAAGAARVDGQIVGVGDVWRDAEGGVWRDQDEVWEFVHLLGDDEEDLPMDDVDWVQFDSEGGNENEPFGFEHRGSLSTEDSDLNPRYVMEVEENSYNDLAGLDVPSTLIKPGQALLSIPARSRRAAKHLRKAEFLLDVFPLPKDLGSDMASDSSRTPTIRAERRAKRRPAPLKLTPRSPALKRAHNPDDAEDLRTEFLQDSFKPRPRRGRQAYHPAPPVLADKALPALAAGDTPVAALVAPRKALTAKSSIANMKGLFKAIGGKKSAAM